MCGIVGYVGTRQAAPILLDGLRRLEYRGYDSAGVAVQNGVGVSVRKLAGRVQGLRETLAREPVTGTSGIAHTRWATHGAPTKRNAHPHVDCGDRLAIVHNGIIENADVLRAALERTGHRFRTETDTETLAHLIEEAPGNTLEERVAGALAHVVGTYGLAAISADEPGKIVVARQGSPVLLGIGEDEVFVASDASAGLEHTRSVVYLDDGDIAGLTPPPAACAQVERIVIVACGTSWHAGLVGRHIIEGLARLPVSVEYASEYRYRPQLGLPGTLTVAISQSGETADTLEAMRAARAAGSKVLGITTAFETP